MSLSLAQISHHWRIW